MKKTLLFLVIFMTFLNADENVTFAGVNCSCEFGISIVDVETEDLGLFYVPSTYTDSTTCYTRVFSAIRYSKSEGPIVNNRNTESISIQRTKFLCDTCFRDENGTCIDNNNTPFICQEEDVPYPPHDDENVTFNYDVLVDAYAETNCATVQGFLETANYSCDEKIRCVIYLEDLDHDGIPNDNDDDIDGDGIPNANDDDIDGDGIPNADDDSPGGASPVPTCAVGEHFRDVNIGDFTCERDDCAIGEHYRNPPFDMTCIPNLDCILTKDSYAFQGLVSESACTYAITNSGGENGTLYTADGSADVCCYLNIIDDNATTPPDNNDTPPPLDCVYPDSMLGLPFQSFVSSDLACDGLTSSLHYSESVTNCSNAYACYYDDTTTPPTDDNTTTDPTTDPTDDNTTEDPTTDPTNDNTTEDPTTDPTDDNTTLDDEYENDDEITTMIEEFNVFASDYKEKVLEITTLADSSIASTKLLVDDLRNLVDNVKAPVISCSGTCNLSFLFHDKTIDWKPKIDYVMSLLRPFILFIVNFYFFYTLLRLAYFVFDRIFTIFTLTMNSSN